MAAINENSLAKFTGILEVRTAGTTGNFTRLASVRWLISNIDTTNIVDIKADDTGSVFKVTDVKATVEAELLEVFDRDTLKLLFNGTTSDVAAAPISVTGEDKGTGWTVWTPIKLSNKNGDETEVANIVIKADGTALTLDTDYAVFVDEDGYTNITPLTAQTGAITADYDYTPTASENITINIDSAVVNNFEVKITSTDNGKDRTITLSSASFVSTYGLSFVDVVEAGDITWATLTFEGNKGSTLTYVDEII